MSYMNYGECVIMSAMVDTLATWLNEELRARSWSGRELARRAGVSHNTIALALRGESQPTFELCRSIAGALGCPPEDLFKRAGLLPTGQPVNGEDELLYYFRELPEQQRRVIVSAAKGLWVDTRGYR